MKTIYRFVLLTIIMMLPTMVLMAQDRIPLQFDQVVTGNISEDNPSDTYTFTGQAGQVISISMSAANSDLDSYLTLITPSGQDSYNDDGGSNTDSLLVAILPIDGVYTIEASSCCETTGVYELLVTLINPMPLAVGQTQTVEVNDSQPYAYLLMDDVPVELLSLFAETIAGDVDIYIEVQDIAGYLLSYGYSVEGSLASIDPLFTRLRATYLVIVYRSDWDDTTGTSATVSVSANTIETQLINVGDTVTGILDDSNPSDHFIFRGAVDDIVNLTGSQLDSNPFSFTVYEPNGYYVTSGYTYYDSDTGVYEIDSLRLSEEGEYMIVVSRATVDGSDEAASTPYSLTLVATEIPVLEPNIAVFGQLDESVPELIYQYNGERGQALRITLDSQGSEYGPSLRVDGPTAFRLSHEIFTMTASSSVPSTLTFDVILSHDGAYIFTVSNAFRDSYGTPRGSFRLLVETLY